MRRGAVYTCLVLAAVTGVLAGFAVWSARQLLETSSWERTSSKLLENQEIRDALGGFLVDELFDNVDVQGEIEGVLPPRLSLLAGPAAGGLRQLAEERAPILLARPQVQEIWEQINKTAHERFVDVIEGDAEALNQDDGRVYLDLGAIVKQLGSQLGIGAVSQIPDGVAQLDIMDASDLEYAKDAVKLLEGAAYILAAVSLLLLVLAVYLAEGWRRAAVRDCGFVFIFIGAVVLVGRSVAGGLVVDALAGTAATQPAAEATMSISTSMLGDLGIAMIGYGIVIILGAWLAAPGPLSTTLRRATTPFIRDRRMLYPILLLIVLLVLAWSPTEGTRRLIPSLVLIGLLVAGAEALRRQGRAEFPDATLASFSESWRERFDSVSAAAKARFASGEETAGPPVSKADDRISQLERLGELHRTGVLNDAEFKREKELVT